ncbi:uncharacterized protein C8Q71DRAFT_757052 [Rhodofomes roseus]|uniref:UBC core domain-containing protein n=1 Tax=Rhodofomes roseus TaxID=34475 RepID=A0ABQ8KH46_9APHY|nr:uncharacterized protein C8Q71DRAFT_757052 [Rhodofomes roseus]KAH9837167.1 hypothetical protein C8Q71DRAFT_757052 [Rhodofomes roseus]
MPPASRRGGVTAKFYQEDIVRRKDDPGLYGIVLRCWHDAEDLPPPAENADPLMRPLQPGEVGVSYFPRPSREILAESQLELVDRNYQPGDLLKCSIDDVASGVVTGIEVKGRLEHAISGEPLQEWKITSEVQTAIDVDMGDYVVYDDWIGQVVEMFDEAVIDMGNGNLVRVPELSARLAVGEKGQDVLPQPMSGVQSLFGFLLGNVRPSNQDTVVAVKRTVLAIAWLAINQSLDPKEAQTRLRPARFWSGPLLSDLTLVRRRAEQAIRVGDRVVLRDSTGVPMTKHGKEDDPSHLLEVRTFIVKETQTLVNVLWQDGTRETLDAKQTIPYLNPDEYDCWPGDHVIWKTEDQRRAAIVQSVNAVDRIAQVRCEDNKQVELASLLELDPHGTSDWSAVAPTDGLGVHRGDFVFIHKPGATNGAEPPMVPRIGEVEEWVREPPVVSGTGHLGGWRREMADIGNKIAERRGRDPTIEEGELQRPHKGDTHLDWFGEVVDLHLDGAVEVVLPSGSTQVLPLQRLTKLADGLEQIEELWGDDISEGEEGSDIDVEEDVEVWEMDGEGQWVGMDDEEDTGDWSTDEGEEDNNMDVDDEEGWSSSDPTVHHGQDHEVPLAVSSDVASVSPLEKVDGTSRSTRPKTPDVPQDATETDDAETAEPDSHWKRFEVLSSAPADHAFYTSPPAQTSRGFMARLSREYRALQSSLPESILVRAYEDRTDLLRCLIIGPENTPYQDAPFVIDWMLDSNFPQSPPIAHFWSWTNGNGRVNPNLYEEGKVCLSILGTWAGDKSETWSAARSSLLQAFVSIQGLVLVKEPWFCEPAYEKLRGTEEGIVNSRLYSEKAYVLSRGFVRRALEMPLGGLEKEIHWFYYTKAKLAKVLNDARALIEKSKTSKEETEADRELAVPRLTGGGIIALERTLAKLQALLDAPPKVPAAQS